MPAIASLEDLKAAQKDLHAMPYALCSLLWEMAEDTLEECVWSPRGKGSSHSKAERGRHPDQEMVVFCCRGKLWLEERTPEQLKGEGG